MEKLRESQAGPDTEPNHQRVQSLLPIEVVILSGIDQIKATHPTNDSKGKDERRQFHPARLRDPGRDWCNPERETGQNRNAKDEETDEPPDTRAPGLRPRQNAKLHPVVQEIGHGCGRRPGANTKAFPVAKKIRAKSRSRSLRSDWIICFWLMQYFRGNKVKPWGSKLMSASPTISVPASSG